MEKSRIADAKDSEQDEKKNPLSARKSSSQEDKAGASSEEVEEKRYISDMPRSTFHRNSTLMMNE